MRVDANEHVYECLKGKHLTPERLRMILNMRLKVLQMVSNPLKRVRFRTRGTAPLYRKTGGDGAQV